MADIIKQIFISMHGAFQPRESCYVDPSFRDFEAEIFGDLRMDHPSSDRTNMYGDVRNLIGDFKKSVKKYTAEKTVNG
jgi:hypothetical protein